MKKRPNIIAVSKTFKIDKILHLIEEGHEDFGENIKKEVKIRLGIELEWEIKILGNR